MSRSLGFRTSDNSEAVHAGGDDRSPLARLSGFRLAFVYEIKSFHAEEFYTSVKDFFLLLG